MAPQTRVMMMPRATANTTIAAATSVSMSVARGADCQGRLQQRCEARCCNAAVWDRRASR